jgi:septal ring-binding cell division protein DamX
MAREELKINIIIKGDHVFMGAQATDCDPKMITLQGDLAAALARVPSFVEESNKAWDIALQNPKSTVPEPVAAPAPVRTATTSSSASKPAAAAPAKQPAQPKFF